LKLNIKIVYYLCRGCRKSNRFLVPIFYYVKKRGNYGSNKLDNSVFYKEFRENVFIEVV
jgi:hypothetical protein